jgi:hypothetical protein
MTEITQSGVPRRSGLRQGGDDTQRPGTTGRTVFHARDRAVRGRARSISISASMPIAAPRLRGSSPCRRRISKSARTLEQLRALEAGMRIDVSLIDSAPMDVNTPEDLEAVRAVFRQPAHLFLMTLVFRP